MAGNLAVVERPGMRPYRAKKPPIAQWFDNDETDGRCGVFVIRTHDREAATVLARATWRIHGPDGPDMPGDVQVTSGWTRLVPWGGPTGDGMWEISATPRPGYLPYVGFEVTW
jgi:hypothetical protein